MLIHKRDPLTRQEVADAFDEIFKFLAAVPGAQKAASQLTATRAAVEQLICGEAPKPFAAPLAADVETVDVRKITDEDVAEHRRNLLRQGKPVHF